MSKVRYEYRKQGEGGEWQEGIPKYPGTYLLRAAAPASFGGMRYSDEKLFTIHPKVIEVAVNEREIRYGDLPTVSAELSFSDSIVCDSFLYGDLSRNETTVKAVMDAIRILDENGEDVSAAYEIHTVESPLYILPREITVTVSDASKVYDGFPLAFDGYELSEGALCEGDTLIALFDRSQTDVGEVLNQPVLTVLQGDGNRDITHFYNIRTVIGNLTVTKRPLIVQSGSLECVYDGEEHSNPSIEIDPSTTLAKGEKLLCDGGISTSESGEYSNVLTFSVLDEENTPKPTIIRFF